MQPSKRPAGGRPLPPAPATVAVSGEPSGRFSGTNRSPSSGAAGRKGPGVATVIVSGGSPGDGPPTSQLPPCPLTTPSSYSSTTSPKYHTLPSSDCAK